MTRRAHQPAPRGRHRRQDGRPVLRLEALEDRNLLSSTPVLPAPLAPGAYDPSQVLVQFRSAAAAPALNLPGAVLGPALAAVPGLYDVRLAGLSVPGALALLRADPRVLSAEPDYYVAAAGTPNDPQFGNQWGLNNTGQSGGTAGVDVHALSAWTVATGSPGVTVAMIDTGFDYNHPDLYRNVWINQAEIPDFWYTKSSAASTTYDKIVHKTDIKTATPGVITFADFNNPVNAGLVWDNNGDGRIDAGDLLRPLAQGGWDSGSTKDGDVIHPDDFFGWNFVANNNDPFDDNGHGTNTAGILGAAGNNGVGVAGLDWQVQLQDLKVFNSSGLSTVSAIVAAIEYSIQHGAKISNNSWSFPGADPSLLSAMQDAQAAGQIVVAAAGNGGAPAPGFPAGYAAQLDNIVSVAAIDRNGNLWYNSNYGATTVTLAAPGVNILSTAPGGGYSWYTGTSQAVPFVTGTLALVWGQHPTWTYKQVISQVTSTTTPLASLKGKTITGGIVNTAAALGASSNGTGNPAPTPHVVGVAFSGPDAHSLNRVVVTFDQVMDPSSWTAALVHLTNPAGRLVALTAVKATAGSGGKQLEIDFNTQTAAGTYTFSIGNGVRSIVGKVLAPYSTTHVLTPATYRFTYAQTTPIPDPGTLVAALTVNQDVTIGSLQVALNITHSFDGDLFITLQAPDGTTIVLVNRRGGSGRNFVNTVLSDAAATAIRNGTAPFTGTFKPEMPLSAFAGKNARGVWKLYVADMSPGDVGVLNNFALTITAASGGGTLAGERVSAPTAGTGKLSPADVVFTSLGAGHGSKRRPGGPAGGALPHEQGGLSHDPWR